MVTRVQDKLIASEELGIEGQIDRQTRVQMLGTLFLTKSNQFKIKGQKFMFVFQVNILENSEGDNVKGQAMIPPRPNIIYTKKKFTLRSDLQKILFYVKTKMLDTRYISIYISK